MRAIHNIDQYIKLGYQSMIFNVFDWAVLFLFMVVYYQHLFSRFWYKAEITGIVLDDWEVKSQIIIINALGISMLLSSGIDQACCQLVSHQIGAFNIKRAKTVFGQFVCFMVSLYTLAFIILYHFNLIEYLSSHDHFEETHGKLCFTMMHSHDI